MWQALYDGLAPALRDAGYLPHPGCPPRYDGSNLAYDGSFLAPPAPDGLRIIQLSYTPAAAMT